TEIANIDTQDRRLTLSMRLGEAAATVSKAQEKRASVAPTKGGGGSDEAKGGTIGELIKQKLGEKFALDKKDDKGDE
ncbi:MAG TPA: hypothetical protein VNO21_16575, partial [Polyangiaceae bacterium]|nr:hypothetical protein [Polyangiaceae bacterium]